VEPDAPYVVHRETIQTKCGWSPFEGVKLPGRVRYTVLRGKLSEATV
jgi:dihydroorotase